MYKEVIEARNLVQDALKDLNQMISSLRKPNPDDITIIISRLDRAKSLLERAREKALTQSNQEFFREQLDQLLKGLRDAKR
jgi:hypothetical protein